MKTMSYTRWLVTELFFTLSVFSAVLFGTYALSIKLQNGLSDVKLSILSGVFFIVFAISQLSSGILINKISPKILLVSSSLLAAIGAIIFSHTSNFEWLFLARVLLGVGLGCTFVGVLYIVQVSFTERQFPFFSSLSQSIANIAAGTMALLGGKILSQYSYKISFSILGILFILSAIGLAWVIPHTRNTQPKNKLTHTFFSALQMVLKKRNFWLATLYFTGLFGAILTFADLFNVTYQIKVFNIPHDDAIMLNAMIPLGVATGGIIAGYLVTRLQKNQLIASIFSFLTLISMIFILYIHLPTQTPKFIWFIVDFTFGIGCGGAMLAFQELQLLFRDITLKPLANSLLLTIAYLISGFIIQPLTGYIISKTQVNQYFKYYTSHYYYNQAEPYFRWIYDAHIHDTWHKFNNGLIVIIIMLIISFISSLFFTRKK